MHLGVMTQGFKVTVSLHRRGDGLAIHRGADREPHIDARQVADAPGEDFLLHLPRETDPDPPSVAFDIQRRILGREPGHDRPQIRGSFRHQDLVRHGRHQLRAFHRCLGTEHIPRNEVCTRDHCCHPRRNATCGGIHEPVSLEHLHLIKPEVFQLRPGFQDTAGDLHMHPGIIALVYKSPQIRAIDPLRCQICQGIEQLRSLLMMQGAPKKHREKLPRCDAGTDVIPGNLPRLVPFLQQGIICQGNLFRIQRHRCSRELCLDVCEQVFLTAPGEIHFVHKHQRGNSRGLQQPPDGFRMRLHSVQARDNDHRKIRSREPALHFTGEIRMPRCVNDLHPGVPPGKSRLLGVNRDPPLPFLDVVIQHRCLFVHPPGPPDGSRCIEQAFNQRGFPRIHMCEDRQHNMFHGFTVPLIAKTGKCRGCRC